MARSLEHESTTQASIIALQGVMKATGASAGRVFLLDLRTGHFRQRAEIGHDTHPDIPSIPAAGSADTAGAPAQDVLEVSARSRRSAWWARTVKSAPSLWHEPSASRRIVRPVLRDETPIALLDIEGTAPLDLPTLEAVAPLLDQVVAKICERRSTLRLLYELQRPIGTDRSRVEYYGNIAELVTKSSGMEFVAIREFDEEDAVLRCVAAHGLGVEAGQLHDLDLAPLEDYPTFHAALSGETVWESTMAADHLAPLRQMSHLQAVRCFVALPIAVGDDIVGVLSLAARCNYHFSRVELRGFETIANAIGVAIANFKNLHASSDQVRRLASFSAGTLSDLLAQAARHEAKGYLDNAQKLLYIVTKGLADRRPATKEVIADIAHVSQQLKQTRDSLDKMKTNALIKPGQIPARVDVRQLVVDSTGQVSGELAAYNIDVGLPPRGTYVQVIPEAVHLALLHLLQNSITAFQSTKAKKRGRRIDISIAARASENDPVQIVFADNATGIDPARLTIPEELRRMPWEEAIFSRGVTGSSDGTGFGLYLVRTLLAKAGGGTPGSVELLEHRNRVVFAVGLPAAD